MKIRLAIDATGPNPAFKPPDPRIDLNAWMTYKYRVPPEIVIPAGTVIDDPWAWIHCLPNEKGVIIAEPIDDDARLMVNGEYPKLNPLDKRRVDNFRAMHVVVAQPEAVAQPIEEPDE